MKIRLGFLKLRFVFNQDCSGCNIVILLNNLMKVQCKCIHAPLAVFMFCASQPGIKMHVKQTTNEQQSSNLSNRFSIGLRSGL